MERIIRSILDTIAFLASLPLHTIPDRATRLLLGEVARADPTTTGWQEIQPDRSQEVFRQGRWVSSRGNHGGVKMTNQKKPLLNRPSRTPTTIPKTF